MICSASALGLQIPVGAGKSPVHRSSTHDVTSPQLVDEPDHANGAGVDAHATTRVTVGLHVGLEAAI